MGRGAEGGGGDREAGGYQLTRELTLDQIGKEISAAIQSLTLAQRKAIGGLLLNELRKPVGTLRRDG